MSAEKMRIIESVEVVGPGRVALGWSGGERVELDLSGWLADRAFAPLRHAGEFAKVRIGEWGHGLEWPSGVEMGADSLWLETLSALRREDARRFVEWRMRHGLSLTKAAEALGLSRRMVAYYSDGEHAVPRHVLLACVGWEAGGVDARLAS